MIALDARTHFHAVGDRVLRHARRQQQVDSERLVGQLANGADVAFLGPGLQLAHAHVFDHALAKRVDGLGLLDVAHGSLRVGRSRPIRALPMGTRLAYRATNSAFWPLSTPPGMMALDLMPFCAKRVVAMVGGILSWERVGCRWGW